MKKLKPLIIIVVLIAIVAGVLIFIFNYRQHKKTAQVVSMESQGMDGYWGDNIQSYGNATSDKAQSTYIAKGTEILSVNVKEGDHVNEGDVLMVVKKDTQDINGKNLELQKSAQTLKFEQLKLDRLLNTKPIPEYVHQQSVYKDKTYISLKKYVARESFTVDSVGTYNAGDYAVVYTYDSQGAQTSVTYLYPGYTDNGGNYKEIKNKDEASVLKDYVASNKDGFDIKEESSTQSVLQSILYLDGETKQIVGEDTFDEEGKTVHSGKPEGLTPSQLKEEIENQTAVVKTQDLSYRKLENELEVMKNTTENGEIIAKVSGTVSKLQDINNYNNTQPFMIVAATDEYYISGAIGEFYLDSVQVGDTVSINCWDNGATAEAVITEISDMPSTDNNFYSGSGNSNSSNYQFKASFDKNSGIELGAAVDITITPKNNEGGGFYIPSYFIRKDASGNYVMKLGKGGTLKKEYVKVGKTLWGSQTEIIDGVTKKDYLAFPYGNGAIEGIKCEKVDNLDGGYGGGIG